MSDTKKPITPVSPITSVESDPFEESEMHRVTLASLGDGVVTPDRDGNVFKLNPVAQKLTGWTPLISRDGPADVTLTHEAGFEGHFVKPVDFKDLVKSMAELMNNNQREGLYLTRLVQTSELIGVDIQ